MADRGTVIKASGKRAFIMNERCEFLEIKVAATIQTGDTIEYRPGDIIIPGRRTPGVLAVAASFIIVCLIAFTAFQHMLAGKVYAYISMEINPGIEIGINSEQKVVSIRGYNDEGKRLISNRDLLKYDIEDALKIIIGDCREGNYLRSEITNDIAVSIHIPGEAGGQGLMKQLDGTVKTTLTENGVSARIYFFSIDKRTMEQAREQDVSPLKYMLWEEAGRMGYSTPLQSVSLKDPRIKEIAEEKEDKIGVGVTSRSETLPPEGKSSAVQAGEDREGRDPGSQVSAPAKQGRTPGSVNDSGAKPREAGDKADNTAGKDSGQPEGEVRSSKNTSGDSKREDQDPGGGPLDDTEEKKTEDRVPAGPAAGNIIQPGSKDTVITEDGSSLTGEAASAQKGKTDVGGGGSSGSGGSSSGGGSSGGGSSGGGSSGGGSSGGKGGSGGGSSGGKGR